MVKKVKKALRAYFFKKEMKKRVYPKRVTGLDEARSIGIIYDASEEESWKQVQAFVKKLLGDGKRVSSMGFFRQNVRPPFLIEQMHQSFFQKKDLSWNLRLKSTVLNVFAEAGFDILIDLSPSDVFLAKYLSGVSYARYKLGRFHPEMVDIYDLMIETDKPLPLRDMIEHCTHYLKLIKNPDAHD